MNHRQLSSKSIAVIGLGFGDEGKGLVVNHLCKEFGSPMVVRYSGGQQAGHTVVIPNGPRHIFSNFGSGTFQWSPTYWSKYCSFDPVGVKREFDIIAEKMDEKWPTLHVDKASPVTTPYDKWYNRKASMAVSHGTCGLGVGATFKREKNNCSFLAGDLRFPSVVKLKLEAVKRYYKDKLFSDVFKEMEDDQELKDRVDFFERVCNVWFPNFSKNITFEDQLYVGSNYIFEGSQGLLLDQNFGFSPHITPSNVGTKNILEMGWRPHVFLVTRAYQTRHGNGPMTNEAIQHNIQENPKETNVQNEYQGKFRKSILDLDLLKYAIERDEYIRTTHDRTLVITCLDQVKNEYRYTVGSQIVRHTSESEFIKGISDYLGVPHVLVCDSPEGNFNEFDFEFYEDTSALSR